MTEKDMTKGVCLKYSLACILGIHPSKVPNFVTKNSKDDLDRVRSWLRRRFNKGLVYMPINQFLESYDCDRDNSLGGPDGYSIVIIGMKDKSEEHAAIAKDGKFFFNPCDNDNNDFSTPNGFLIMYDLG